MAESVPIVYLLHGEDTYGMAGFVAAIQEKMGDPSMAEMNTTRLEGSGLDLDSLRGAASAIPFLAERRLVVATDLTRKFSTKEQQEKVLALFESLPQSTALVLIEPKALTGSNWLLKWAKSVPEKAYVREYFVPKGADMTTWIRKYAGQNGGEITPRAASLLAEMVMDEPRMAAQELDKLLAYVNYSRKIEEEDVDQLAAFAGKRGDYFKLIDAIAARNGRQAMDMLERLFDEQEALQLFFSLVGHFRLLIQAREIVEQGGQDGTVASELGIHPFRAKKMTSQAKSLSMGALQDIYHRMLEYDTEIKTGQIDGELALETLVAGLTAG